MTQQVNVLVADSHLRQFDQVRKSLRSAGLKKIQSQKAIGTITGEVEESKRQKLKAIPGVAEVEFAQSFQLPPPDSEIQ